MKHLKLIVRLLLSIGLVALLFFSTDWRELFEIVRRGQPLFLAIAFVIGLGDRLLMAFKWNLLLRVKNIIISHFKATITYWISTFFGLFLPATIGGDAVRAFSVTRDGYDSKDVISSIVVERLLGFVALFTFVCVSIVLSLAVFGQSFFPGIWRLFWTFAVLLVVSTAVLIISLNQTIAGQISNLLNTYIPRLQSNKFAQKIGRLYQSYLSYQDKKGALVTFYLLSILESMFPLFWTYFLARAFLIDVPLLFFFILIPIVLVLVRLPISIDGFGLQEGAFVYFLGLIGVPAEEALLLGLASHFLALLTVLPGGLLFIFSGMNKQKGNPLAAIRGQWQN